MSGCTGSRATAPGLGFRMSRGSFLSPWGRHINEVLHLTVKPREWWERELGKHWKTVECIGGTEDDFEIVGRG